MMQGRRQLRSELDSWNRLSSAVGPSHRRSAEACLPAQVREGIEAGIPAEQASVLWSDCRTRAPQALCRFPADCIPKALGGVRQASFRRPATGTALPRPLHPSRRNQQSPIVGFRWGARHIPVEGLCPRK